MSLLLWMLGCAGEAPVEEVEAGTLTLRLVNPTEVDPFEGVTELRLELEAEGELIFDQTFGVDEELRVPDVSEFGLLRFRLAGLSGDEVLAYGRSAEIYVGPGVEPTVPIAFLPVNQVIPLAERMVRPRSEHRALRLLDGRVVLFGGRNSNRSQAFDDLEIYNPVSGDFSALGAYLPTATLLPEIAWLDEERVMVSGGLTLVGGSALPVPTVSLFDTTTLEMEAVASMAHPRAGHCFAYYRSRQGIVVGGAADESDAEWLRPELGTEVWSWTETPLDGLDGRRVDACVTAAGGQVYIQGLDGASTGVFDFTEAAAVANPEIRDAFYPVDPSPSGGPLVEGAMLVPMEDGDVWISGGLGVEDGAATRSAWRFDMAARTWVSAVEPASSRVDGDWQAWIDEGWVVLGCGSVDGLATRAQTAIELINLETGDRFAEVNADRARPGCAITTLADGAILLTGGFSASDAGRSEAAIFVPYEG